MFNSYHVTEHDIVNPATDQDIERMSERAIINRYRDRLIRAAHLYADRGSLARADELLESAEQFGDC